MRCIWPLERSDNLETPELCKEDGDFLVEGCSYCEEHTILFFQIAKHEAATQEIRHSVEDSSEPYPWASPEELGRQLDNQTIGTWTSGISYNGGGDE